MSWRLRQGPAPRRGRPPGSCPPRQTGGPGTWTRAPTGRGRAPGEAGTPTLAGPRSLPSVTRAPGRCCHYGTPGPGRHCQGRHRPGTLLPVGTAPGATGPGPVETLALVSAGAMAPALEGTPVLVP